MLDFLLLPTSRTYWHDHMQAPNPRTPSFLDSLPNTSTPAYVLFKLQWQQLDISHETTKEAWTILETTYEGTKKVKDMKLQILTTRFE